MSLNHRVDALIDGGEYKSALALLSTEPSLPESLMASMVFLQAHVGDLRKARGAAETLLKRHTEPRTSAICRQVLSRSLLVHGDHASEGLKLSSEAVEIARRHLGPAAHARYAAEHVLTVLHRVSINEASTQISTLRRLVLASGDVQALISTHLIQAGIRIKQAQLRKALLDLRTIQDLLIRHPHLILEGQWALAGAAIESLDGTASEAKRLAEQALAQADRSGSLSLRIPALVTLGHILLLSGDLHGCACRLDEALRYVRPSSPALIALLDTRMQLMLARDSLQEAAAQSVEVERLSSRFEGGYSYYGLWHLHTRARWLLQVGRAQEALATAENGLPYIERSADRHLLVRMQLTAAEAMGACGRRLDGSALLATVARQNPDPPLEIVAEASRVSGCLATDYQGAALEHFRRAARLFEALGHHWALASTSRLASLIEKAPRQSYRARDRCMSAAHAIETSSALTYLVRHPKLLGAEVKSLLQEAGACSNAVLIEDGRVGTDGDAEAVHSEVGTVERSVSPYGAKIGLGSVGSVAYGLRVEACANPFARGSIKSVERLVSVVMALERLRQEERERSDYWPEDSTEEQLGLVFASRAMSELVRVTRQIAPKDVTVLITGETGTGKEVFARALHNASGRIGSTFVPFNCTTVPRDMLDSQLFGYRRGSFTGAAQEYPGLIRAAQGGTLFLDEIGEMPLELQPKLLRFLESGEILPLGETRPIHVDVRVVAATNADLDRLVSDGRFREDLFYRLHVVRLRIPPLRDRREEIPLLVRAMADRIARESQREPLRLSDAALEYLTLYHWPGNARQLANELHRLMALTEPGVLVMPGHLSPEIAGPLAPEPVTGHGSLELLVRTNQTLTSAVEQVERTLITQALDRYDGNLERAAKALGLSRKGLFLKRQRLGLA
jgi:DNA-binding NtrC family response regulator/tetratricopeptide (TPR) repeat protein